MRAIAILAVLLFHFVPNAMPAGFYGVDIFIVISGYVITRGLLREYADTGDISIRRFYFRRARRLLPALLAMLSVIAIAAHLLLLPIHLEIFGKKLAQALMFAINLFAAGAQDYFATGSQENPLLNLWSLALEEQFYLIAPLVTLFFLRRWPRYLAMFIGVAILLSWLLHHVGLLTDRGLFYLLPGRIWEFGVGALLACRPPRRHHTAPESQALSLVGMATLLVCLTLSTPIWHLAGATLVVLATGAVIRAGENGTVTWVGKGLSWRPARQVGKLSYALYLWHWPLLYLASKALPDPGSPLTLVLLLLSTAILATLSWYLVERPFLTGRVARKPAMLLGGVVTLALSLYALAAVFKHGLPDRLSAETRVYSDVIDAFYHCEQPQPTGEVSARGCRVGRQIEAATPVDTVLLGNSHAQMYIPAIAPALRDAGWTAFAPQMPLCKPFYGLNIDQSCRVRMDRLIDHVADNADIKQVIIAFDWDQPKSLWVGAGNADGLPMATIDATRRGLDSTIDRLRAKGKKVLLIGPLAMPKYSIAIDMAQRTHLGYPVDTVPTGEDREAFLARWGTLIDFYAHDPRLEGFMRPDLWQCTDRCWYIRDGVVLFADRSHLTTKAVGNLAPAMRAFLLAGPS